MGLALKVRRWTITPEVDRLFQFFLENQNQLVKEYEGKVIVLHKNMVEAVFDRDLDAYLYGKSHFTPGTFIIQKCIKGEEAYTQTISTLGVVL